MNHTLRMLIGCMLPLALIFVLPRFGVSSGVTLLGFIGLMFLCHLMMMGGHGHDGHTRHGAGKKPGRHGGGGHRPFEPDHPADKEPDDERTEIHQHHQR